MFLVTRCIFTEFAKTAWANPIDSFLKTERDIFMGKFVIINTAVLAMGMFVGITWAEVTTQPPEKNQYHLFNPAPVALMREMATDRPDKTESPFTVDAGHYQIETSLLDYTYDHDNPDKPDTRTDKFSVAPTNLKAGLLNNVDLQLVINPYITEHTKSSGVIERKNGFGNLITRLKVNVWGNDGGKTAFAVMPFLKFPTNGANLGNDALEGGVIFPLAVELLNNWGMGLMTEFDFNQDSADEDYHTKFINTITFGHQIIGNWDGYVEFYSNVSTEEGSRWIGTVDTGLTYALTKDIQLDIGVNVGVTKSADDLNPFAGLSIRY